MESGQRTAAGRISKASHADVQRLRSGGEPVQRHGFEEEFLTFVAMRSRRDGGATKTHDPLVQTGRLSRLPDPAGAPGMESLQRRSGGQPYRSHHPRDRRLDSAFPDHHARHYADSQTNRTPLLIRYRRMFGLFAFFYGTLHFLTYVWLDKFFDLHEMLHDIAKRKFITVGFTGFVLL